MQPPFGSSAPPLSILPLLRQARMPSAANAIRPSNAVCFFLRDGMSMELERLGSNSDPG